ncbi:MAG: endoribonuclease [Clostridia bacterium]|jgi:enamine deaminase RidA (YjgF/YER057c/UK114 family)|nr:endoribonuclease [Clostridia bacterium]
MRDVNKRLEELGITLPEAPAKGGVYTPCKKFGDNLYYVSGCGPIIGEQGYYGKLGKELTIEQGQEAARNCILNALAVIKAEIGDLGKIKNLVKILTFVACENDFYAQPQVANGGSELLGELFGDLPARSAIGTNALPGNIAVETEIMFEVEKD